MTDDFFRARLEQMIDLKHPLAVLASRLPWAQLESTLAPAFARKTRDGKVIADSDLFGATVEIAGSGPSAAGRPRLSIRLMTSLLYLKHAYNLSDEDVVDRWAENVVWQYFSGQTYYEPKLPCDATQVGRFRTAIGEAGVEELLKATIDTAVSTQAVRPAEFERIIVDSTVQEKAIAHPVDSRLLEIARGKVVQAAKFAGIALKQTFVKEGRELRRKAGGYAHAKQFRRLRRTVKRQRTILGIVLREIKRKLSTAAAESAYTITRLNTLLERAERIRTQQPKDKNKLYALHAPEVECIGKGKARKPYEFGVKASIAVTHKSRLMVGARTFPGNPYDGHVLNQQLEQTTILLEDTGRAPKQVVVDLGYRGVDKDNPGVEIIHRGKYKSLTTQQRRWLKRRQAVEPAIGHLKSDHRMDRCWLQGSMGDALHTILFAASYNLRWLLRAMVRLGLTALLLRPLFLALLAAVLRANPFQRIQSASELSVEFAVGRVRCILQGRLMKAEAQENRKSRPAKGEMTARLLHANLNYMIDLKHMLKELVGKRGGRRLNRSTPRLRAKGYLVWSRATRTPALFGNTAKDLSHVQ